MHAVPRSRRGHPSTSRLASTRRRTPARTTSFAPSTSSRGTSISTRGRATSSALGLPDQILCRADCAGLCPVCGKDLNVEPHEHDEAAVDSRWAALEALRGDGPAE